MSRRFDLVLLDFDGTLADSQTLLVGLVNEVIAASGYPRAHPAAVAGTIGLPLRTVFSSALPSLNPPAVDELCTRYRARADRPEFVCQFRLFPEVAETLAALRALDTHLVIATSKARATTLDILRHCGIDQLIDDVIGGDCVTLGKPHPEMVQRALGHFLPAPGRTLLVGDTTYDIRMGQSAGVATCAATYGMQPASELGRLRPDFMIDRFALLRALVVGANSDTDTSAVG